MAKDTRRRAPQFSAIPAHDLADALDVPEHWRPGSEWSVLEIVKQTATGHRTFIEGTMVSCSQGDEWILPEGTPQRTPSFWERPSSLFVEGEESRAAILKALGVNLSYSPTYRKYR